MSKKETLMKIDLIGKLLTTEMSVEKDENGIIFIDRDPVLFKRILNDVRNEREIITNDRYLIDECKYYGIKYKNKVVNYFKLFSVCERDESRCSPRTLYNNQHIIVFDDDTEFDELKEKNIMTETVTVCDDVGERCRESIYINSDGYSYMPIDETHKKCKSCQEVFIININNLEYINKILYKHEIRVIY